MGTEAEGTTPETQNTDPATTPEATPPVAPATPPPPPVMPQAPQGGEPNWLSARLQRERDKAERDFAKQLGVPVAEAKEKLKALQKLEDAKKSDTERLTERNTELEAKARRAAELEAAIKARADVEMKALSEAQQKAVQAIAGTDSAAVLTAIDQLKPTWTPAAPPVTESAAAAATTTNEAATPTAPTPTAPATTTPTGVAPAGNDGAGEQDHKAVYEGHKQTNPYAAAIYLNKYRKQIYPPR
jgi:hypothetical protein